MCSSIFRSIGFSMFAFVMACLVPAAGFAAEGPVGEWNLLISAQGQEAPAALEITEENGVYSGTLTPPDGVRELSDIKFEDGKLTAKIVVEEAGMTLDLSVTISGDSITGMLAIPDMGMEMPLTGTRAGAAPAIVGTWNLMVDSQLGNNPRELVVNDDLSGTYGGGDFDDFPITDLSVDGASVEFDVTLSVQGQEFPSHVTVTIDGNKISGELDYGQGTSTIVGEKAVSSIVGKWNLMVDSQLGNNPRMLVVNDDLSGTYGGGDFDEFPISELTVDGDAVKFNVTLAVQGQELPASVTLTLDGNSVSGELDFGQGTASIVGEKDGQ